jgi:low affinity Fe/Cu permease
MPHQQPLPHESPAAGFFARLAGTITNLAGTTLVFCIAVGIVLAWAVSGPFFHYSETWQLVINTGTTIVTFLMVFLIQRAQNKDSLVLHLKLNELIAATPGASNRLINAQDFTEAEAAMLYRFYCLLADKARQDADLGMTHTVEEAEDNHAAKSAARRHRPRQAQQSGNTPGKNGHSNSRPK